VALEGVTNNCRVTVSSQPRMSSRGMCTSHSHNVCSLTHNAFPLTSNTSSLTHNAFPLSHKHIPHPYSLTTHSHSPSNTSSLTLNAFPLSHKHILTHSQRIPTLSQTHPHSLTTHSHSPSNTSSLTRIPTHPQTHPHSPSTHSHSLTNTFTPLNIPTTCGFWNIPPFLTRNTVDQPLIAAFKISFSQTTDSKFDTTSVCKSADWKSRWIISANGVWICLDREQECVE